MPPPHTLRLCATRPHVGLGRTSLCSDICGPRPFFVVIAGRLSVRGCLPRGRSPLHEAQTDSQTTKYSSQWAAEHAFITPLPDKKFALSVDRTSSREVRGALYDVRGLRTRASWRRFCSANAHDYQE